MVKPHLIGVSFLFIIRTNYGILKIVIYTIDFMRGRLYTREIKEKARKLVLAGNTYREIKEILGIPKSTLSVWFGKTIKKPMDRRALLNHLANIRKLAAAAIQKKFDKARREKQNSIEKIVKREIKKFPRDNIVVCKALLAMLYWAEGAKHKGVSGLSFVNTDPALVEFYLNLLRRCYKIDETRFRIRLHLHYYHRIAATKKFWAKLTNIPLRRFGKIYIKRRSKTKRFRKNFMGICFIKYLDSNIREELLELARQLQRSV